MFYKNRKKYPPERNDFQFNEGATECISKDWRKLWKTDSQCQVQHLV